MNILKKNILTSYLLSVPIILFTFIIILAIPAVLSGEPWILILIVTNYGWEFLGSFIFLMIAIWIGSKKTHQDLIDGKGLLKTSFNYALLINLSTLGTFILITIFSNNEINGFLLVIIFLISVISMTLTIGLLVSHLFRGNIRKTK